MLKQLKFYLPVTAVWLLLLGLLWLAGCGASGAAEPAGEAGNDAAMEGEMDHEEIDDDHEEGEHAPNRIPNQDGAAVRILSPADGDSFPAGDQVIVEIALENFELGGGNHWHIYVDGASWGMVMGENTDQPLTGLEPGEHEIAVFLSIDTHEEYEEGDHVVITVKE